MQRLERLLRSYARRTLARWWIGEKPDVRDGRLALAIAQQVSYPADPAAFTATDLLPLDRKQAAHVLAVAGTTGLAYGREPSPRVGSLEEAAEALDDLKGDATFLSNGSWLPFPSRSWTAMTSATFDCGLIGYDADNAFIFWVEEED